jgi:flagellar motor switch protein FliG
MKDAAKTMQKSGIRKAAILVASLDQAAADALLDRLDSEQAALVRQAVMAIDELDPREFQRVIDEFRRASPRALDRYDGGIELDGLPLARTRQEHLPSQDGAENPDSTDLHPADPTNDLEDDGEEADVVPFGFLHNAEDDDLAHLLGGERPQTAALVLSRLTSERAGAILACFAPAMQIEVVRRLVDLENTDPEVLREVEKSLETRLSRYFAARSERSAGPEAVAEILGACNQNARRRILDNLAASDSSLAEQFGRRPMHFEDLVQFDDARLSAILHAVEPEVVEAALLGAAPAILERFLRCVDPEESRRLNHNLSHPEPICLSEIEDARRQIAALAERMSSIAPEKTAIAA